MQSNFLYKKELILPDVVELLKNYPIQYEHRVTLVMLREQGDLSMLMN
jgi:hypothetical protein